MKFEELLEKYGKSVDDIDFEYEGLSDEELEEAFAKAFGEEVSPESEEPDDLEEEVKPEEKFADDDQEDEPDDEPEEPVIDDDTLPPTYKKVVNGMEFELSLSDIQNAMYDLVNATYAESDNDYYGCEIYQDSKSVVMIGMWSGKAYRQNYKMRNGVYSLVGDRVPVRASWLTADEEAELDKMRANYSSISDKLAKYESEPEKMEILNSEDYANIADTAEFAELKKEENHFDMSVEDLKAELDKQLLAYAKGNKIEFAEKDEKKTVGMKMFGQKSNKKPGRYGNLFRK